MAPGAMPGRPPQERLAVGEQFDLVWCFALATPHDPLHAEASVGTEEELAPGAPAWAGLQEVGTHPPAHRVQAHRPQYRLAPRSRRSLPLRASYGLGSSEGGSKGHRSAETATLRKEMLVASRER
eukprot:CAMPEP_0180540578 /NCGR_PEP_ID=MMETSP1036_2-20121128/67486_1 /TAXON_ID=632150 /ORGANISM="Azadinium spinosum, Strain 3D9" /LENGTH=124 /DNA_ID=CAMNT_0022555373 /DNA_START=12 /DNA_END=384 /DNA_ORIENTATION=-